MIIYFPRSQTFNLSFRSLDLDQSYQKRYRKISDNIMPKIYDEMKLFSQLKKINSEWTQHIKKYPLNAKLFTITRVLICFNRPL